MMIFRGCLRFGYQNCLFASSIRILITVSGLLIQTVYLIILLLWISGLKLLTQNILFETE